MADPRRGDIWLVNWSPGRGSEQLGRCPALVIQTDAANANPRYPNTIVLTISTKGLPVTSHVPISPSAENGLYEFSFVKCEQILTVSKARLERKMGRVSTTDITRAETALRTVLSI